MTTYSNIRFNNFDLTTLPYTFFNLIDDHNLPTRELEVSKLAYADGNKLTDAHFAGKEIIIEGYIGANTRKGYQAARKALLAKVTGVEALLNYDQADGRITYTATVENVIFSDTGGGFGTFSIKFVASDPFGYSTSYATILSNSSISTASSLKTFLTPIDGSYKAKPIITVVISAVTGGSGWVRISDPLTNNSVKITRTFTASTLVINSETQSVTVGGVEVDYTGSLMANGLAIGATQLLYEDYFTSRTATMTVQYRRRSL